MDRKEILKIIYKHYSPTNNGNGSLDCLAGALEEILRKTEPDEIVEFKKEDYDHQEGTTQICRIQIVKDRVEAIKEDGDFVAIFLKNKQDPIYVSDSYEDVCKAIQIKKDKHNKMRFISKGG